MNIATHTDVRESPGSRSKGSPRPQRRSADFYPPRPAHIQRMYQYADRYTGVKDPRIRGSTWTNVKAEIDIPDRHELFLLADGERKVEMETVTRKSTLSM